MGTTCSTKRRRKVIKIGDNRIKVNESRVISEQPNTPEFRQRKDMSNLLLSDLMDKGKREEDFIVSKKKFKTEESQLVTSQV